MVTRRMSIWHLPFLVNMSFGKIFRRRRSFTVSTSLGANTWESQEVCVNLFSVDSSLIAATAETIERIVFVSHANATPNDLSETASITFLNRTRRPGEVP